MLLGKQLILAAVVVLGVTSIASPQSRPSQFSEPSPTKDRPLLTLDLHKLTGADRSVRDGDKAGATLGSAVEFADSNLISWEWTTRDEASLRLKVGTPIPPSRPVHHHAVLLSTMTGEKKSALDFYAHQYSGYSQAVGDGRILTCVEKKVRLFSSGFELLGEQDLPAANSCFFIIPNSEHASVSPSRHSFLVSYSEGKGYPAVILDTNTLAVISQWHQDTPVSISSISDHWQAGVCQNPWEICVRELGGSWHALNLKELENLPPIRDLGSPHFVSDDAIVICGLNQMAVAKVDGSVLLRVNLPKDRSFERSLPATSSDGSRFAVMENKHIHADPLCDMCTNEAEDRIVVYDISERRAVFALKVTGEGEQFWSRTHLNQFALSPDGDRLAVVSDGVLRIYKLPARSVAH